MSAFYDDLQLTADELLTEFGQAVTLTNTGAAATYDPATGATSGSGSTTQNAIGAVLEYSTFIRQGVRNEASSLIRAGDRQLLLSPFAADGTALTAPSVDDTVTVGAVTYTLTAVATNAPAGTVVYYDCNIRGAA